MERSAPTRPTHPATHAVRAIENVWIPGHDGIRLAARLWLPVGAEERPVPAVVEYVPYAKRDWTRARDETLHAWFAARGLACLRIDVRGSGDSEGLLGDEYAPEELADGVAAIGWIAAQRWCTGAVGLLGKSWGGINALQIAALAPPALKAVITVCSADDRYADDAHYMGGCALTENLTWGAALFTLAAQPPDPLVFGAGWRDAWLARLDALPLYAERWLAHPERDDYWRRGSVSEDYAAIRCPVFAVGGWADAYTNAIPRLLEGLRVPRKALVGPWAHHYPHRGVPGPAIDFPGEALAWWRRWLTDGEPESDGDPLYRVWMQDGVRPASFHALRPGRWVAEDAWPSPRIAPLDLALRADGMQREPGGPRVVRTVSSACDVGRDAGVWCGFGFEGDAPGDQRCDDAGSLVLDTAPLATRVECLGAAVVELELASDRSAGLLAVRLVDVAPDGSCERVSYGLLNLAHRAGHERAEPLEPGRFVRVRVALNHAGHAFAAGHRVRLALSTAYWPIAWPSAERATLSVVLGGDAPGVLRLPVRPPRAEDDALRPFAEPEPAPPSGLTDIDPGGVRARSFASADGEVVRELEVDTDGEHGVALTRVDATGWTHGHALVERFAIRPDDPLSARIDLEQRTLARRDGWSARVRTRTTLTATREAFRIVAELEAREGDELVRRRAWDVSVPRAPSAADVSA